MFGETVRSVEDLTRGGKTWDLNFDMPGNHPFRQVRRAVEPQGTYVLIGHAAFGAIGHRWLGRIPRLLCDTSCPVSL